MFVERDVAGDSFTVSGVDAAQVLKILSFEVLFYWLSDNPPDGSVNHAVALQTESNPHFLLLIIGSVRTVKIINLKFLK